MLDEWWIVRDSEGSSRGVMRYYADVWLEGLMNTTKHLIEGSRCHRRDPSPSSTECTSLER
jgi:hypothetical protein